MPDRAPLSEKRRHTRTALDLTLFPFLGTRVADHACFEYLPVEISEGGLRIAIPRWLVSREQLNENEGVNLHLPFRFEEKVFDRGTISWSRWDEGSDAQVYGIRVDASPPTPPLLFFGWEDQAFVAVCPEYSLGHEILNQVMKDLFLLKKGVLIYLNHLIPYFSRITLYPSEEYPMLKEFFLDDIRFKVKEHQEKLEALYDQALGGMHGQEEIARNLDLEEVRSLVESEIYLEILKTTFQSDAVMPYLNAIKALEDRLYLRYNSLVILYVQSL
jgi:hypothetical protein